MVGGENIFFNLNIMTVPAEISEFIILANATILKDLCPKHVIALFVFGETPSHAKTPSIGNT